MTEVVQVESKPFWLHYVGTGLYNRSVFENEAKRLGVQRAIGFSLLGSFEWGTPVLLAHHRKSEGGGEAEVFGYFTINGVSHGFLGEEVEKLLHDKLDIVKESGGKAKTVSRACGNYAVGGVSYIRDSLQELVRKVQEACDEAGVNPNVVKWFLNGVYHPFESSMKLSPAKFARGFFRVQLEGFSLEAEKEEERSLAWIYDYERKTYLSRKRRDALVTNGMEAYC